MSFAMRVPFMSFTKNTRAGERTRLKNGKGRHGNEMGLLHDLNDWSNLGNF